MTVRVAFSYLPNTLFSPPHYSVFVYTFVKEICCLSLAFKTSALICSCVQVFLEVLIAEG